jgi:hypothetical protein
VENLQRPKRAHSSEDKVSGRSDVSDGSGSETYFERVSTEVEGLSMDHSSHIAARIQEWLSEIEEIRRKSTNLQGTLSGRMKILIKNIKDANTLLSIRVNVTGDPEYWKQKYEEQKKENVEIKVKVHALEEVQRRREMERKNSSVVLTANERISLYEEDGGTVLSTYLEEESYLPDERVDNLPERKLELRGDKKECKIGKVKSRISKVGELNDDMDTIIANNLQENCKNNLKVLQSLEGLTNGISI